MRKAENGKRKTALAAETRGFSVGAKVHIKIDVSTLTRGAAFITRALSTIKKSGGEKKGGVSVLKYVYALAGVRLFE